MKALMTLAVPPAGVPRACVADVTEQLEKALGLDIRTVIANDVDDAVRDNRTDLAVVGAAAAKSTRIDRAVAAAYLRRRSIRDCVLARRGSLQPSWANPFGLAEGARVAVSSPRQAGAALSWCDVVISMTGPMTGILDEPHDACVVPETELEVLTYDRDLVDEVPLRPEVLLPAPGHAACVLLARADAPHLLRVSSLHDRTTERCVAAELELLELMGSHGGGLGCLAQELADGAIRLMASLSRIDESLRSATVTKVAALTPDPLEAARACFAAFEEIEPGL